MSENQSTATYRQQCASALTHPVTLAALGVLLLNDLVFKALWSNPWTTGKLSDLGWVIFASPQLAFLLSPSTGNSCRAQRVAWVVAYVGLPLLYAAFNTFATVHNAILGGLSFVSHGTAGSPLDPSDSLVIPLGLAIALWVGQRSKGQVGLGRQHFVMVTAGLAVVASIATSYAEPHYSGIFGFALTEENTVVSPLSGAIGSSPVLIAPTAPATSGQVVAMATGWGTSDGGLTWAWPSNFRQSDHSQLQSVETPRGRFAIVGAAIIHTGESGGRAEVYSADYLSGGAGEWVQIQNTRDRLSIQQIIRRPQAIIYDPQSGNVILAMGSQGVVVGTPDGEWTPVAVGPFVPVVSSARERTRTLLGASEFWHSVILLPLAGVAVVTALTLIFGGTISPSAPLQDRAFPIVSIGFGGFALILALSMLLNFQDFGDPTDLLHNAGRFALAFLGIVLAVVALALCGRPIELWKSIGVELISWRHMLLTFSAMAALTALSLIMWIQLNVSPAFVHVSAAVLVILTGFAMLCYLLSKRRLEPKTSGPPPADEET